MVVLWTKKSQNETSRRWNSTLSGRKHITRQREIIARHILEGIDAFDAEELLALLEGSQVLHERHRDRLIQELGWLRQRLSKYRHLLARSCGRRVARAIATSTNAP
jgi:hypothetical protein